MKIFIPHSSSPKTGKGFFCNRLYNEFKKQGHHMIEDPMERHDVSLHIGKIMGWNSTKTVYRIDGIINNIKTTSLNKKLQKNIRRADGVIYQSDFCKFMCDKYLGTISSKYDIIFNGDDIYRFSDLEKYNTGYKYNFVASARWRPHKRLRDIVKSFLVADIDNSCLLIAGDLSKSGLKKRDIKRWESDKIRFLGLLGQNELSGIYAASLAIIHIAWIDWCPNAVVEAICSGCIPITNNIGGAMELAKSSNGVICNIDKEYRGEAIDVYNPPKIDYTSVAEAMRYCVNNKIDVNKDSVDIKNIAKKYYKLFQSVIEL